MAKFTALKLIRLVILQRNLQAVLFSSLLDSYVATCHDGYLFAVRIVLFNQPFPCSDEMIE